MGYYQMTVACVLLAVICAVNSFPSDSYNHPPKYGRCYGNDGKTFPIIGVCYAYFLCVHGEEVYKECEYGYSFDAQKGTCVYDDKCYREKTPVKPVKVPHGRCYGNDGKTFPITGVCYAYFLCVHYEEVYKECEYGYSFDAQKGTCVYDDKCYREKTPVKPVKVPHGRCYGNDGKTFPIIGVCYAYFLCVHYEEVYKECEYGYSFDAQKGTCVYDDKCYREKKPVKPVKVPHGRCYDNDGKTFPINGVCYAFFKCVHGEEVYKECEYGSSFDPYKGTCVPDKTCSSACPRWILPDPHDETRFLLNGKSRPCPYGLFFDFRVCTCVRKNAKKHH